VHLPVTHATPLPCFEKKRKKEEVNREWGRTSIFGIVAEELSSLEELSSVLRN